MEKELEWENPTPSTLLCSLAWLKQSRRPVRNQDREISAGQEQ